MKILSRLALGFALAVGLVPLLAGSASGHSLSGTEITCSTVSGTFNDFTAADHPIVWHVKVGDGSFATATTTESPAAFVGTGVASANVTSMTDTLQGKSATVQVFATWSTGQSDTTSATLTCGTAVSPITAAPPVTAVQPQVSAGEATAPAARVVAPAVSPATAVVAATPRFTG
jgi:hypothetical protein